jgi:hypothetical protein
VFSGFYLILLKRAPFSRTFPRDTTLLQEFDSVIPIHENEALRMLALNPFFLESVVRIIKIISFGKQLVSPLFSFLPEPQPVA